MMMLIILGYATDDCYLILLKLRVLSETHIFLIRSTKSVLLFVLLPDPFLLIDL